MYVNFYVEEMYCLCKFLFMDSAICVFKDVCVKESGLADRGGGEALLAALQ